METLVHINSGAVSLKGMLKLPKNARGIVLFSHGSGSSRFSPRNNFVADILVEAGIGVLLIDLLTKEEDAVYQTRFNIPLLTDRLIHIVQWLKETRNLKIALFGSSTGAAAALEVAATIGSEITAVVSRGGRVDLAQARFSDVVSPTLLIVGEHDFGVLEMNQDAYQKLTCSKKLVIIPNATHLFEEPGCLEKVAQAAKEWFKSHLP